MVIAFDFLLALLVLMLLAPVIFAVFVLLAATVTVGYLLVGIYLCYTWLLRRMHVRPTGNRHAAVNRVPRG